MERDTRDAMEWLVGLVLGAASVVPQTDLESMDTVTGSTGEFEIFGRSPDGKPLVETDEWRLYPARLPSGQMGLMKISTSPEWNDRLRREAEVLGKLRAVADQIDKIVTTRGERPYFYSAQFPQVVETIDADGRLAMFLILGAHPSLSTYQQFRPLSLLTKDERVDFQTLVWLLGKGLRFLDFLHRQCRHAIDFMDPSNVFVETKLHGVLFWDFSFTKGNPSEGECQTEVAAMARMAWFAAGGTDTVEPPHDPEIMDAGHHNEFVAFLRQLMAGETDAITAHTALYELADKIWPKEEYEPGKFKRHFHQWAVYPRVEKGV